MHVSAIENLQLTMYVIGFPVQGEMILTLLTDGSTVKKSFLTDCYLRTKNQVDIFAGWCKKRGVKHLDAIFITHPDVDHCTGLSMLLKKMDSDCSTILYMPDQIIAVRDVSHAIVRNSLRYVNKHYSIENGNLCLLTMDDYRGRTILELNIQPSMQPEMQMEFVQLAPTKGYLFGRNTNKSQASHNDVSLVYAIVCNGFNYLFCADMPAEVAKNIDREYLQQVQFVKIPHHGSKDNNVDLLANLSSGQATNIISASTVFKKLAERSKLPKTEVLEGYKKIGRVYCTGPKHKSEPKQIQSYGGVKIHYFLFDRKKKPLSRCVGNAFEI